MPTSRKPYPYRKRHKPSGPVTRFTVSGVQPGGEFPDTLHWAEGTVSGRNAQLCREAVELARQQGLSLTDPVSAQAALCALFLPHTVKIT